MFAKAYRLPFTLLGIPVLLDVTFLIVLPLFAWLIGVQLKRSQDMFGLPLEASGLQEGYIPYALGLIIAIGLFVSVVIHELGHSVVARRYGVKVKSITLWLLGGMAQFEEMPKQRGAEAVVAIVGPITSFAVGGVAFLIGRIIPPEIVAGRVIFYYLFFMNVALAIFNLLPAMPLDGGRVLRSLLALRMPHLRATRISSGIAKTLAVIMGLFGFMGGGLWFLLLAFFIYMAATAETQQSLIVEMLNGVGVRDVMTRDVISVPPEMPVGELTQTMFRERHLGFPVVDPQGELIGLVALENVRGVEPATTVGQVMSPQITTIREEASALDAFGLMSRNNFGRLIVTGPGGRMSGIVTKTDLMRAIQIRMAGLDGAYPIEEPFRQQVETVRA